MQFSFSFVFHFIFSLAGFFMIGIYLCRGSWRNPLRKPLALGFALIAFAHLYGAHGMLGTSGYLVLAALFGWLYFQTQRKTDYVPSDVREGHNVFSLLAGAALFALTVQLHSVLFGIPVFQLVK